MLCVCRGGERVTLALAALDAVASRVAGVRPTRHNVAPWAASAPASPALPHRWRLYYCNVSVQGVHPGAPPLRQTQVTLSLFPVERELYCASEVSSLLIKS